MPNVAADYIDSMRSAGQMPDTKTTLKFGQVKMRQLVLLCTT